MRNDVTDEEFDNDTGFMVQMALLMSQKHSNNKLNSRSVPRCERKCLRSRSRKGSSLTFVRNVWNVSGGRDFKTADDGFKGVFRDEQKWLTSELGKKTEEGQHFRNSFDITAMNDQHCVHFILASEDENIK